MTVLRIIPSIASPALDALRQFCRSLFDLNVEMDRGWIVTLAADSAARTQLSLATAGSSGTPLPDLPIKASDLDEGRTKAQGLRIAHTLTDKPRGLRRFYLHTPAGKLVNVLSHRKQATQSTPRRGTPT